MTDRGKKIQRMRRLAKQLTEVTTHPEYIKIFKKIESLPSSEAKAYAKKVATPSELKRRGIPLPNGFRVTTRVFENPSSSVIRAEKTGQVDLRPNKEPSETAITLCGSVGYIVCATIGGEIEDEDDDDDE